MPVSVVSLAFLSWIGFVSYRSVSGFVATSSWVSQTHTVLERIAELRVAVIDIQNGVRGFALTGREEYLAPLTAGTARSDLLCVQLEGILSNPDQRRRLSEVKALIRERLSVARQVIDARRTQGLEAAALVVEQGVGKRLTDEIRGLLDGLEAEERNALASRETDALLGSRRTMQVLGGILGLAGLLVVAVAFFMHRYLEWRRRSEVQLRESHEELHAFLENASDMIQSVAADGAFLYVNRKWTVTLGYSAEEARKMTLRQIVLPEKWPEVEAARATVLSGRPIENFETVIVARDGRRIVVSGNITPRMIEGKVGATQGIYRDITSGKRAEEEMQRSNEALIGSVRELEQRSRELAELSEMGDLLQSCQNLDEAFGIIQTAAATIFPEDAGALGILSSSRNVVEVVANWGGRDVGERVFEPEDCWALRRGRMHTVEGPESAVRCPHAGASAGTYTCVPLVAQGEALGLLHLRISGEAASLGRGFKPGREQLLRTVADRVALAVANLRLRDVLRQQSVRDPLTGLFNRRYMEESLEREIRRAVRHGRPLGILMLDLDHFKRFNDNHGHTAGDALLREFGLMLGSGIRAGDIACRYGGEEFAVILPDAPLEISRSRAEQLREKTRRILVQYRGQSLGPLTVSIGVSAFPQHGTASDVLLRAADLALYSAKRAGRDRVEVAEARHA